MKKIIHLAVLGWALFTLYTKGPALSATLQANVKQMASTQQACAGHTSDANAAIAWATTGK